MNSMVDISDKERQMAARVDSGIVGSLAVSEAGTGVAFRDASQMCEFAKLMSVSSAGVRKHLRGNSGACLAILTQALEWGMSPFAVANQSYFVNDQIAFQSMLVQAVILKRAPIKGRIKFEYTGEGQGRSCKAWARLREDPDEIVEYQSPAIKDIKVKNSPLWVADPDQQLSYFAGRSLCRRHFPDVLLGVYADDELEPGVGPEKARDVTPPKNLSEKFDRLAAAPTRQPAADDHVFDADVQADGAVTNETEIADPFPDPARAALLKKLEPKAAKGTDALRRALAGLSEPDTALLTEADHDALGAAADAADKAGVA